MPDEEKQESQPGVQRQIEAVTVQISITRAESYTYSNVASVSVSPMDFRIDFADATVDGQSKTVAGITMSPEHAVGLVKTLTKQIGNFEKQFGKIRVSGLRPTQTPGTDNE